MAKRKQETDETGNPIALAELPKWPTLPTEHELQYAIADLAKVKAQIKALEAEEEQREQQIIDTLFEQGRVDFTIPDQVKVVIQNKTTRTVQPAKLIAAGVDPHIVEAATNVSVSAPFLRLYPKAPTK